MKSKFAERLRELRGEKHLSQAQLSKALNGKISSTAIAQWELDQTVPNLNAVILLARFFGVSLDYISGEKDY